MKVAVFGLGYVGVVSAACLASRGADVWGVDIDPAKLDLVADGKSPVIEPGLDELVSDAVTRGALHATDRPATALEGADLSLVCVGTPSSPKGRADLSHVMGVVDDIGRGLRGMPSSGFHTLVVRSTVPPGTVDQVVTPALRALVRDGAGPEVATAMCPEFLREGSGVADFLDPPLTVIGTEEPRAAAAVSALLSFLDRPVHVVSTCTAEALKYACNAFHATKVSFVNELARVFRSLDIDTREVMDLFCQDTQLNISPRYLRPGFAFGGPCLPKDLRALLQLARANDVDVPVLEGTLASNELTMAEVVDRVIGGDHRTIALLGLSFKSDSDDLRESPNVQLAETLLGKGFDVRIHDPIVKPVRLIGTNRAYVQSWLPHLERLLHDTAFAALEGADLAIVSSCDGDMIDALVTIPPARIIDLTGRLGSRVESLAGYEGVGW